MKNPITVVTGRSRMASGAQLGPTARAAVGDNLAAALGGHSRTKTVTAFADQFAGLEGTFHGISPLRTSGP